MKRGNGEAAFMADRKHILSLDDYEHRLLVQGLMAFRNGVLQEGKPAQDVDDLLLKVLDAPVRGKGRLFDHAAR